MWAEGPFGLVTMSSVTKTVFPTGQTGSGSTTLIRMRGEVLLQMVSASAALDGFKQLAIGIGIVSGDAFGIGSTAIPGPRTDSTWGGWLWYWTGTMQASSASVTSVEGSQVARIPIDSKAMRKISPNETIFGAIEAETEVGTYVLAAELSTRFLVKLS